MRGGSDSNQADLGAPSVAVRRALATHAHSHTACSRLPRRHSRLPCSPLPPTDTPHLRVSLGEEGQGTAGKAAAKGHARGQTQAVWEFTRLCGLVAASLGWPVGRKCCQSAGMHTRFPPARHPRCLRPTNGLECLCKWAGSRASPARVPAPPAAWGRPRCARCAPPSTAPVFPLPIFQRGASPPLRPSTHYRMLSLTKILLPCPTPQPHHVSRRRRRQLGRDPHRRPDHPGRPGRAHKRKYTPRRPP